MTNLPPHPFVQALYTEHHGWLKGWLAKRLGNAAEAADLAHDTFVRLMSRQPASRVREPRALMTHVAKGLLVDHWRRREVEAAYLETLAHLPEPRVPPPEVGLIVMETLLRVDAMLQGLPVFTREVFLMVQLEGRSLADVAEATGKPVITVRRHIHKALLACLEGAAQA